MPLYPYKCPLCGFELEKLWKTFDSVEPVFCPKCCTSMKKQLSSEFTFDAGLFRHYRWDLGKKQDKIVCYPDHTRRVDYNESYETGGI